MFGLFRRLTVTEGCGALVFRDGTIDRVLGPGRHVLRRRETAEIFATAPQVLYISGQDLLSADGFPVRATAVVVWRFTDARKGWLSGERFGHARFYLAAQLALRDAIAPRGLDALIGERAAIEAALLPPIAAAAEQLGMAADEARLRDLALPADARRLLTEPERARREAQAALERARGELAALRALANAARMLKGNPELQNLRLLQALAAPAGKPAPTLVLGQAALAPIGTTPDPQPGGEENG